MVKQSNLSKRRFYGATTIGEKGQVVIPADVRVLMKLKKGDKLLVFGIGDTIALTKLEQIEQFANHLSTRLQAIKKIIKKNK